MALVLILASLVVFYVATLLWGADSREQFDSPEWERRAHWP
jgi:nitrogen fixation-related uncharacterized protein